MGLSGDSVVKNPPANAREHRRCGFSPWVGKIPHWLPTPVFLLENPMDRGAWPAIVHGVKRVGHGSVIEHTHMRYSVSQFLMFILY